MFSGHLLEYDVTNIIIVPEDMAYEWRRYLDLHYLCIR